MPKVLRGHVGQPLALAPGAQPPRVAVGVGIRPQKPVAGAGPEAALDLGQALAARAGQHVRAPRSVRLDLGLDDLSVDHLQAAPDVDDARPQVDVSPLESALLRPPEAQPQAAGHGGLVLPPDEAERQRADLRRAQVGRLVARVHGRQPDAARGGVDHLVAVQLVAHGRAEDLPQRLVGAPCRARPPGEVVGGEPGVDVAHPYVLHLPRRELARDVVAPVAVVALRRPRRQVGVVVLVETIVVVPKLHFFAPFLSEIPGAYAPCAQHGRLGLPRKKQAHGRGDRRGKIATERKDECWRN